MSFERQFLDHLPVIDQVVQFIGRRHRLPADAIEELQSAVHLKIIDNDYEVLRKFDGRSNIRTYLTSVVQRHFLDSRTAVWGRWRPCACARRAGPAGVLLDQLLIRVRAPGLPDLTSDRSPAEAALPAARGHLQGDAARKAHGLTREQVLAVVGNPDLEMGKTINWPDLEKRPEVRPCDE